MPDEKSQQADVTHQDLGSGVRDLTDDQIWDSAGKAQEDLVEQDEPSASPQDVTGDDGGDEEEDESAAAEVESFEMEAHSTTTAADEDEGKHDYRKRYKDLEKEFHRRNEETKDLRDQFQQLRLERLEMERELERLKPKGSQDTPSQQEQATPKQASPLDDNWFDDDTKQTLEDFSELTSAYKKLIAHEVAKAMSGQADPSEKIAQLEQTANEYRVRQYWLRHAAEMRHAIGSDYMTIDGSDEFGQYVRSSPVREYIMSNSNDWNDHIAVMKDFLETPTGKSKFRPEGWTDGQQLQVSEESSSPPPKPKENQGAVRRKAAQGLLKNSSPRQERRLEDMSDDELWESINA